jgi:hypothetical protein
MIDREAANAEVRARLRQQVAEIAYDDAAANLLERLFVGTFNTPAVFVEISFVSGRELTPERPTQEIEVEVMIGLVFQGVQEKGTKGLDKIVPKVMKALHWWQPSWARKKLKFRGEEQAVLEGTRIGSQLKFATAIHETFS